MLAAQLGHAVRKLAQAKTLAKGAKTLERDVHYKRVNGDGMKNRVWTVMGIGLAVATSYVGCLPRSGDTVVDRNKDGISDAESTAVRAVDTVTQEAPASPTCVVFGSLLHGYTGAPLANQAFEIVTGKNQTLSATTDGEGGFMVTGVSIGDYRINVAADQMVPFNDVFNCDYSPGNVDNNTVFVGRIYLLPTDSTATFVAYTVDGDPLPANEVLYIETPTALVDNRTDVNSAAVPKAAGIRTTAVTTNAEGVAALAGVPDPKKLFSLNCTNVSSSSSASWTMYRVVAATVDINADGVYDYCGVLENFHACDAAEWNNEFRLTPFTRVNHGDLSIIASNTTHRDYAQWGVVGGSGSAGDTYDYQPSLVSATESIVLIFSRPVDLETADLAIINEWPNRREEVAPLGMDTTHLDNSTPFRPGQALPIDPFTAISKPASGSPTLTLGIDPSGTIVTLTPTTGFSAGRIYYVTGSIAGMPTSSGDVDIFQFSPGMVGFFVAPAAGQALEVTNVYLESSTPNGEGGYNNVVIIFNQPVRGYDAARLMGGVGTGEPYVLVCFDEELQGNGFAQNPEGALDHFECPQPDFKVVTERDIGAGKGLVPAYLRPVPGVSGVTGGELRDGFSRVYEFQPSGPLIGRTGGAMKVFFPIADGAPYIDYNQATLVNGSAVPAHTSVDATFDLVGPTPNLLTDYATNPNPSLQ